MGTYQELVTAIKSTADGAYFDFDIPKVNNQHPPTFDGAVQIDRTLTFPYPGGNTAPYLWYNNPEKIPPSENPIYLWSRHLDGSSTGTPYDIGINGLDCRNLLYPAADGAAFQSGLNSGQITLENVSDQRTCQFPVPWRKRSLFLWFRPDSTTTQIQMQVARELNGAKNSVLGLRFGFLGLGLGIVKDAQDCLKDYYTKVPSFANAAIFHGNDGWQRFTLGEFPARTAPGGNPTPCVTGLIKLLLTAPGTLVLSCQYSDTPTVHPPLPGNITLAQTDAHAMIFPVSELPPHNYATTPRRLRGSFASRSAGLHAATRTASGMIVLPDPSIPPAENDFSSIHYFTNHENEDTGTQDLDWCRPNEILPGDVAWNATIATQPMGNIYFNQVPLQFQSNYQVEARISVRLCNHFAEPIKVALLAVPPPPTKDDKPQGVISLMDIDNANSIKRIIPTGPTNVARRDPGEQAQIIRVAVYDIPNCIDQDIIRTFCVVNGTTGRFYYCLVPLIESAPPPPPAAPGGSGDSENPEGGASVCESTTADTSATLGTTLTGTIDTFTLPTPDSTTASSTITSNTPNTGITPETDSTAVTADSGTNSGSGTTATPGTLTPVTETTPVTFPPPF